MFAEGVGVDADVGVVLNANEELALAPPNENGLLLLVLAGCCGVAPKLNVLSLFFSAGTAPKGFDGAAALAPDEKLNVLA